MDFNPDTMEEIDITVGGKYRSFVEVAGTWYEMTAEDEPLVELETRDYSFATGKTVQTLDIPSTNDLLVIEDGNITEIDEWLQERTNDWHKYIPETDHNAEFWQSPQTLYHGTTEDHLAGVVETGLEMRNETRGISNRNTGAAVFTTVNEDFAMTHYGDHVICIDMVRMKNDGRMPNVGMETPLHEAQMIEAIAWTLDYEDYQHEGLHTSDGLDPDTFIVYGDIPAEYLSVDGMPIEQYARQLGVLGPELDDLDTSIEMTGDVAPSLESVEDLGRDNVIPASNHNSLDRSW